MHPRCTILTPTLILLALATAFLVGCHNNYEMPPPRPPVNVSNAGIKLALRTTPATLRQMDPTAFTIRLTDRHAHPLNGAGVTVALVMPAMDMGRNVVVARPQGPGVYVGTGRFSMGGDWSVVVTATQGAHKAIETFPVHVR